MSRVQAVYVAAAEGETGKSGVAIGVLEALRRRAHRVGVFRPIRRSADGDAVLATLLEHTTAGLDAATVVGTTYEAVHHDPEGALAVIVERFGVVAAACDAVLILGSDYTDVGTPTELAFNARIAANLGAPVLLVIGGRRADGTGPRTADEVSQVTEIALVEFRSEHDALFGVVVNRASPTELDDIVRGVRLLLPDRTPVFAVPEDPMLATPMLTTVLDAAKGELLPGARSSSGRNVHATVVAASTLEHLLPDLTEGALVVLPGDRTETLAGVLLAHGSPAAPSLAGVLLTGGIDVSPNVAHLIAGLPVTLPIARTPLGTYDAARIASGTRSRMAAESPAKAERAIALFDEFVDAERLLAALDLQPAPPVTPLIFEHELHVRARALHRHIVLPEGDDDRILRAASVVLAGGLAELTILGDEPSIRARAAEIGADIGRARVLSPFAEPLHERFAEVYARARAKKGVTLESARDTVRDVSYFGTLMVHEGLADGMVSGARHTTAQTIRPAFELIKTAPGVSVVSSVFLMALADRVLVYGDCAVIPDPTSDQLADIAISAARTATRFGIEPRVAMLSYSTGDSGAGADVEQVRRAVALVRERAPELPVDGPIQYDAAADPTVAAAKMPGSPIAGRATVFVFPDLNTGNTTYKAVQRSSNALAIGPVLQGLNKPVNDLSRGALVRDIVNTIAVTAIQAQPQPLAVPGAAERAVPA